MAHGCRSVVLWNPDYVIHSSEEIAMPLPTDLEDGESTQVNGSGSAVYTLKNVGGVYSCTCPAWRNQSVGIERRTCKHLRRFRGEAAEAERCGNPASPIATSRSSTADAGDDAAANTEAPVLLAESWDGVIDVTDWWISEKLDGVRAYWDGRQFLSRLGNVYAAPPWFTAGLPPFPLDGELWLERKQFQRTVSIVRRKDQSDHWRQIRYVVFDAPGVAEPFESRLEFVKELLRRKTPEFALAHEHARCQGIVHLKDELQRIESLGGEGLMLRQPGSLYVAGRSSTLLKVKTFIDAEARVIGHLAGAGRHRGRLGALQVLLPDGTQFSVGTGFTDAQRGAPPAIGSVITFRYQELSDAGVPRFPSFVGVRSDEPITVGTAEPSAPLHPRSSRRPAARPAATHVSAPLEPVPLPQKRQVSRQDSPASPASDSHTGAAGARRYFEFRDGKSAKFWEIVVSSHEVTVRFGKIGTAGQSQTKSFSDDAAVQKHVNALIREKTGKGYAEQPATE